MFEPSNDTLEVLFISNLSLITNGTDEIEIRIISEVCPATVCGLGYGFWKRREQTRTTSHRSNLRVKKVKGCCTLRKPQLTNHNYSVKLLDANSLCRFYSFQHTAYTKWVNGTVPIFESNWKRLCHTIHSSQEVSRSGQHKVCVAKRSFKDRSHP